MEADKVLVVEDDPDVRAALTRALSFEGYEVAVAEDGGRALEAILRDPPSVIVLDVMMPFVDGLETCRRLRARGDETPILMLTALGDVSDRVDGLDAGADDYLAKPFALEELLARIRALLRRSSGDVSELLTFSDLEMNLATRTVVRSGEPVQLTKTEFDLLEVLMRSGGRVASRDQIYRDVWGFDFETSSNSLDVYVGYLRRKTEAGGASRLIHTVRGVGYTLRDDS
ncbi:MAG: response regulator transcription factor [Acidimicrobiia bacterium]|jgi:two-component system response regulator MprA